jgi:hypothetical protein
MYIRWLVLASFHVVRSEFLAVVLCDMTLCRLVNSINILEKTSSFHLQCRRDSAVKLEALYSFGTLLPNYQIIRRYI